MATERHLSLCIGVHDEDENVYNHLKRRPRSTVRRRIVSHPPVALHLSIAPRTIQPLLLPLPKSTVNIFKKLEPQLLGVALCQQD